MATPVPTLVGNFTADGTATITIPNTTPPAVGDLLVAFLAAYQSGGSRSWDAAPTGFSELEVQTGSAHIARLMVKVATSDDVAAANFAFTANASCDVVAGAIVKVTNVAATPTGTDSEIDTGTTSFTATTDLTPTQIESIMLVLYTNAQNDSSGGTIGSYASTPSLTWAELLDTPNANGAPAMGFAVAYANISGTSNYTQRTATSTSTTSTTRSIAVLINGLQNVSVSPSVLVANASIQAPTVTASALTSAGVIVASASVQAPSVAITDPKWSTTDKSSSTWTNTDKS